MITMHARLTQTDGQRDRRTNIMAIARRFIITNASRAKTLVKLSVGNYFIKTFK